MDFNLPMPYDKDLTEEEKTAIDEYVDKTYEEFKDNGKQLTRLAAQASSAISAGKAKAEKLANQGPLKNLWGNITGKNRKLRGEIDRDFAVSLEIRFRRVLIKCSRLNGSITVLESVTTVLLLKDIIIPQSFK